MTCIRSTSAVIPRVAASSDPEALGVQDLVVVAQVHARLELLELAHPGRGTALPSLPGNDLSVEPEVDVANWLIGRRVHGHAAHLAVVHAAARFEAAYDRALAFKSRGR